MIFYNFLIHLDRVFHIVLVFYNIYKCDATRKNVNLATINLLQHLKNTGFRNVTSQILALLRGLMMLYKSLS